MATTRITTTRTMTTTKGRRSTLKKSSEMRRDSERKLSPSAKSLKQAKERFTSNERDFKLELKQVNEENERLASQTNELAKQLKEAKADVELLTERLKLSEHDAKKAASKATEAQKDARALKFERKNLLEECETLRQLYREKCSQLDALRIQHEQEDRKPESGCDVHDAWELLEKAKKSNENLTALYEAKFAKLSEEKDTALALSRQLGQLIDACISPTNNGRTNGKNDPLRGLVTKFAVLIRAIKPDNFRLPRDPTVTDLLELNIEELIAAVAAGGSLSDADVESEVTSMSSKDKKVVGHKKKRQRSE
eukprot:Colp12_sorted_trinity150504_noHs@18114